MTYHNLTIVDYAGQFFAGEIAHTLVDVRTRSEYTAGHIPGAINIPLDELNTRLHEIVRTEPVVVVCASGNRSRTGAEILEEAGFVNVHNLQGGTMSWMLGMRPIEV